MKLDDDDFTLFGLPRRYTLDRAALDERWRTLQGEVHPDRNATQGAAAQRVAMQWSVRVNEAYRRLKDPLSRAAYLCELHGVAIEAENNTAMPREFLLQQMDWREALDEAESRDAVEALEARVDGAERALLADAAQRLDAEPADADGAVSAVRSLMFVRRFRQELDRRVERFEA